MAKMTMWQCDRCRAQVVQDASPHGWVKAGIRPADESYTSEIASRLWCKPCWNEMGSLLPLNTEAGR